MGNFSEQNWGDSPERHQPDRLDHLTEGHWVVCADGSFGFEVVRDLESAGLDVLLVDPADGCLDVSGAVGFIAGAESDIVNMANAAQARIENDELFIAVRQNSTVNEAPLRAFDPDSVFVPTELLARETVPAASSPHSETTSTGETTPSTQCDGDGRLLQRRQVRHVV